MKRVELIITVGEPAGIGPDIVLQLAAREPALFSNTLIIANTSLLRARASLLQLPCSLNIIDIPLAAPVVPGQLDSRNAAFVVAMLNEAMQLVYKHKNSAIVTAPIHKGILNQAGFDIKGHTDFFARHTQSHTVMMLMNAQLKIALFSDHIPLRKVPEQLNKTQLTRCIDILLEEFPKKFQREHPAILVCGLNPHAGEQGYLGEEENTVILPVLNEYRAQGQRLIGPIGADVAFTPAFRSQADVILALYHDQGLPVIKYSGFHETINVTLGLPFVRTSVDHGTALDIAGTHRTNDRSLALAIQSARTQLHNN